MNPNHRRIHFQGKDYIWTGAEWVEAGTHLTPPAWIIHELNALAEDDLRAADTSLNGRGRRNCSPPPARRAMPANIAAPRSCSAAPNPWNPATLPFSTVLSSVYPRAAIRRRPSPQPKPIAMPIIPPSSPPAPPPSATSAAGRRPNAPSAIPWPSKAATKHSASPAASKRPVRTYTTERTGGPCGRKQTSATRPLIPDS